MRRIRVVGSLTTITLLALWGCGGADSVAPSAALSKADPSASDAASSRAADMDLVASTAPAVAIVAAGFLRAEEAGSSLAPLARTSTAASCGIQSANLTFAFAPQDQSEKDDVESHDDAGAVADTASVALTGEFFSAVGCENAFVADSSDSVVFTASAHEVFHDRRFIVTTDESGAFSVFGDPTLAAAKDHLWNGTATGTVTATHQRTHNARTLAGTVLDTTVTVSYPNPLDGATVPTSGTFTRRFSGSLTPNTHGKEKPKPVDRRVVVTFDGDEAAPLQLLDTATGKVLLTCVVHLGPAHFGQADCHEEGDED